MERMGIVVEQSAVSNQHSALSPETFSPTPKLRCIHGKQGWAEITFARVASFAVNLICFRAEC